MSMDTSGQMHAEDGDAQDDDKDVGTQDGNIADALDVIKRVVAGDFEARLTHITAEGELGELLYTVNDLIDRCDAYIRESAACMDHVSKNKYFRKIIETSMQGAFLDASITVNTALLSMQQKVDDFSEIADNFETTVGAVVEIVSSAATELTASSEALRHLASETSERSTAVAAAAEQASTNVQTVAAASEELTGSITEISRQVSTATELASDAANTSQHVGQQVKHLQEAAGQISSVVNLINDIASQTNLLALNATIEAARAGDAGRGFSVVAAEVKLLAQQTSDATKKIGEYVSSIQGATEDTVSGINEISDKVSEISDANTAVSAAVEEQSAATKEIARNIEEASTGTQEVTSNISGVSTASQETKASAAEVNSAAGELSKQSEVLRNEVSDFLVAVRKVV